MKQKSVLEAHVDDEGRLILPAVLLRQHGLRPGSQVPLGDNGHGILLRRPVTHLAKVYIEPTNRCNLTCRTCIRNTWNEPMGLMDSATFTRAIDGLRGFAAPVTIVFGGFGEPLLHPALVDMVAEAKGIGADVELITNGTLLSRDVSRRLLTAGLDVLWVSLDGSTEEGYGGVRPGAALDAVVSNVMHYCTLSFRFTRRLSHIGIIYVAMRSTIAELPDVIRLGRKLLADRFLITNVLPYTEELCAEVLYNAALINVAGVPSPWLPQIAMSRIDSSEVTREPLYRVAREWQGRGGEHYLWSSANNVCPFIERGSISLSWDGGISPCLPLLHSHTSFLRERKRTSRRYVTGNVNDHSVRELWFRPDYVAFRERVQSFQFSPCTQCGGCNLSEENEEDCLGNTFPTCGGCLWAQGIIQCP